MLDIALIQKYNRPCPRYTSYPPAPCFTEELSAEVVSRALETSRFEPLSLYFHLPFCRSLCWFCGCTTIITNDQSQSGRYLSYLERELASYQNLIAKRPLVQLHFGGGTPNFLTAAEIRQLGEAIHRTVSFAPDAECSVEIDPRTSNAEKIAAFAELGMTRASLGVQDNNPQVQEAVHRIQPLEITTECVAQLRAAGFKAINIDLIYGLPHQTRGTFLQTLEETIHLAPERITLFSYAHVPWLKKTQKVLTPNLPSPEEKCHLFLLGMETLAKHGYHYIGLDHFARREDPLFTAQREGTLQRNFQGYSTKAGADIVALGVSAISQTRDFYWQNTKELADYTSRLDSNHTPVIRGYSMTSDDLVRRTVIQRLMCHLQCDFAKISLEYSLNIATYFQDSFAQLDELLADGLVSWQGETLSVTELGRLFLRNIAYCFDATKSTQPSAPTQQKGQYSQTV